MRDLQQPTRHRSMSPALQVKGGCHPQMPQLRREPPRVEQSLPGETPQSTTGHRSPKSMGPKPLQRSPGYFRVGHAKHPQATSHTKPPAHSRLSPTSNPSAYRTTSTTKLHHSRPNTPRTHNSLTTSSLKTLLSDFALTLSQMLKQDLNQAKLTAAVDCVVNSHVPTPATPPASQPAVLKPLTTAAVQEHSSSPPASSNATQPTSQPATYNNNQPATSNNSQPNSNKPSQLASSSSSQLLSHNDSHHTSNPHQQYVTTPPTPPTSATCASCSGTYGMPTRSCQRRSSGRIPLAGNISPKGSPTPSPRLSLLRHTASSRPLTRMLNPCQEHHPLCPCARHGLLRRRSRCHGSDTHTPKHLTAGI